MSKAFQVVKDFERELCAYTGAPYAVSTNSCTMAILLAVAWHLRNPADRPSLLSPDSKQWNKTPVEMRPEIEIPKRTYIGVPMSIIHAGGRPTFRDEDWNGMYRLSPLPVWDAARRFTSGMYEGIGVAGWPEIGAIQCVSFHWSKILGIQQGGAILHDNPEADEWLRRARFDGRKEGMHPSADPFPMIGWHCYMSPEVAAAGLVRMQFLPEHNEDLPNSEYPDLSTLGIFK